MKFTVPIDELSFITILVIVLIYWERILIEISEVVYNVAGIVIDELNEPV